jgi:hypothetical protein
MVIGWIRNFVKFCLKKKYFRISRNFAEEYLEISRKKDKKQDPGHDSNQIGQHKNCATDIREHAKIGQLCELDPGHISNQIGQPNKMSNNNYLRNFATFICEISRNKF